MGKSIGELVTLAKQDDQNAINELYNQTFKKAYFVARSALKSADGDYSSQIEDIVQDAYVKAFSSLGKLEDPEKFQGWLDTIVMNRCRDFWKKKKPVLFSDMSTENSDDGSTLEFEDSQENERIEFQPEESIDYSETKRLVAEMLDRMPEEQKMCLLMYYYEEMSVGQIAQAMDCSEGTIKSRLNYARKNLKGQVLELEKKGTKLYCMPLLPFLYWFFREQAADFIGGSAAGAVAAGAAGTTSAAVSSGSFAGEEASAAGNSVAQLSSSSASGNAALSASMGAGENVSAVGTTAGTTANAVEAGGLAAAGGATAAGAASASSAATAAAGAAVKTAAVAAGKASLGLGAKIAIAGVSAAVVVGGGTAAAASGVLPISLPWVQEETEESTEAMEEESEEAMESETETTEEATEEITEETEAAGVDLSQFQLDENGMLPREAYENDRNREAAEAYAEVLTTQPEFQRTPHTDFILVYKMDVNQDGVLELLAENVGKDEEGFGVEPYILTYDGKVNVEKIQGSYSSLDGRLSPAILPNEKKVILYDGGDSGVRMQRFSMENGSLKLDRSSYIELEYEDELMIRTDPETEKDLRQMLELDDIQDEEIKDPDALLYPSQVSEYGILSAIKQAQNIGE